jgi:hypothetical protein
MTPLHQSDQKPFILTSVLSFFALVSFLSPDRTFIRSLLDLARLGRLILAIAGVIQLSRGKVSFYHGTILCINLWLLSIPQYARHFLSLPGREKDHRERRKDRKRQKDEDVLLERITDALGCLFQFVVECLLIGPAVQLLDVNIGCLQPPGETLDDSHIDRYISLSKISPNAIELTLALIIDGIFLACKSWQIFRRHPPGESPGWNRLTLVISTAIACVLWAWLLLTIGALNALDGSTQKEWSFGQWVALCGIIPALVVVVRFVLRYYGVWHQACISSFKLI